MASASYVSPSGVRMRSPLAPLATSPGQRSPGQPQVQLEALDKQNPSSLFQRRAHKPKEEGLGGMDGAVCFRCKEGFGPDDKIVSSGKETWHPDCFVCAQCFQPFPDDVFYEYEGRKYCERDFHVLYAPCCGKCGDFIIGRVIRALNSSWHPHCFLCDMCTKPLAEEGFVKNAGRALCRDCNTREKASGLGKYVCHKCHGIIDDGMLRHKGEVFHPYHFSCHTCRVELTAEARERQGELYCLRCHDKMGIPICGACRRPVEERVVHALGKAWHVEHFVCGKCEKPFLGNKYYEKKGVAYCQLHYHQLFGNICYNCDSVIPGNVFRAVHKSFCDDHFTCSVCDRKMPQKTKFYDVDLRPVCKHCYERFPPDLKKRLKVLFELEQKGLLQTEAVAKMLKN